MPLTSCVTMRVMKVGFCPGGVRRSYTYLQETHTQSEHTDPHKSLGHNTLYFSITHGLRGGVSYNAVINSTHSNSRRAHPEGFDLEFGNSTFTYRPYKHTRGHADKSAPVITHLLRKLPVVVFQ
jgi:hypothetical protein